MSTPPMTTRVRFLVRLSMLGRLCARHEPGQARPGPGGRTHPPDRAWAHTLISGHTRPVRSRVRSCALPEAGQHLPGGHHGQGGSRPPGRTSRIIRDRRQLHWRFTPTQPSMVEAPRSEDFRSGHLSRIGGGNEWGPSLSPKPAWTDSAGTYRRNSADSAGRCGAQRALWRQRVRNSAETATVNAVTT